jgi:hypothetical protein
MGMIEHCALAIVGIAGAALSIFLAAELRAWMPWLTDHLIKRAMRQLHYEDRNRYDEEWRSHINETPGETAKLLVAIALQYASYRMSDTPPLSLRLKRFFSEDYIKKSMNLWFLLGIFISCPFPPLIDYFINHHLRSPIKYGTYFGSLIVMLPVYVIAYAKFRRFLSTRSWFRQLADGILRKSPRRRAGR